MEALDHRCLVELLLVVAHLTLELDQLLSLLLNHLDILLRPRHHLIGLGLLQLDPAVLQFCSQTLYLVFQLLEIH